MPRIPPTSEAVPAQSVPSVMVSDAPVTAHCFSRPLRGRTGGRDDRAMDEDPAGTRIAFCDPHVAVTRIAQSEPHQVRTSSS